MRIHRLSRAIWLAVGLVFMACGVIGALLPVIPTTPFLLLAAYCFARSSPRLDQWLRGHRTFGPLIANWERNGAIDRRSKTLALATMALSPIVTYTIGVPPWALVMQILVLAGAAIFVASRPSPAPARRPEIETASTGVSCEKAGPVFRQHQCSSL